MKTLVAAALLALTLPLFSPTAASAEVSIIFYVGRQLTSEGDLRLRRGDTDVTFQDVRWTEKSFTPPIFYGIRASYWFDRTNEWGIALDFTHAKTILREEDIVPVKGERHGSPVDAREPISDSIKHFELSHGLNMLTFNGLHRWFPSGTRDESPSGRLQCYAGLGAGFSIPHVEAHIDGDRTGIYQFPGGPVVNGMLGLNYDFARNVSGIFEYKLSYSDAHAALNGGGEIEAPTFNNQFISGLSGNFVH